MKLNIPSLVRQPPVTLREAILEALEAYAGPGALPAEDERDLIEHLACSIQSFLDSKGSGVVASGA